MSYTADTLLFKAQLPPGKSGIVNRVTPKDAHWEHLSVEVRRLAKGETWTSETGQTEAVFVILSGVANIASNRGEWENVGRRKSVFAGMPHALYVSRSTSLTVTAADEMLEFAYATAPATTDHPPRLVTPDDVKIEIRGGHNNTRQINQIVPPGFDCERLVAVEVYTPSGNWSSYPPHKHDAHRVAADGQLAEGDLEEFYCYKFAKPDGWALQRIYTDDRSTDATVVAEDGDVVLVPFGYHPVSAGYGYDCYYLNFLAGSAQTLACVDDPAHAWVKDTWTATDPRVPLVTHAMEKAPR